MKAVFVASAVLASWLALSGRAQAATGVETPDAEAAASALIADAARAYDQNQLDEALRLLARAYELSPRPSILYNQAQVLRTKNDCAAALDAYQRFIATTTPTDPNRERAEHRRTEMQTCVDQQRAAAAEPTPLPVSPSAASPPAPGPVQLAITDHAPPDPAPPVAAAPTITTSPAEDPGRSRRQTMRVGGWVLLGVGVLAASAAAAYAWQAHNIQEELNADLASPAPTWGSEQRARDEEGRRDATRARWFGSAAALAGAGGTALLIVARPPGGDAPGSAASHAAAFAEWSGTF